MLTTDMTWHQLSILWGVCQHKPRLSLKSVRILLLSNNVKILPRWYGNWKLVDVYQGIVYQDIGCFVYQDIGCVCVSRHLSQNICPAFVYLVNSKFWMQSQDKVTANTSHWASCHICTNTHVNMTKPTTTTCQYVDRRPLFELHLVFLGFRSARTTTVNGADVENLFTEWKWKCSVDIF